MRRRTLFLAATLASVPGLALAATRRSRPAGPEPRRITLRHAANGNRFSGIYHNGIAPDAAAMADISEVLADTRTGAIRAFDPAAIDILWDLGARQRMTEFLILSGYRTPATNAAVHGAGDSQHLRAAALDIQVAPARLPDFVETALRLRRGGVGSYPQQGFVHIDSGPVRNWGGDGTLLATARAPVRVDPRVERMNRMAEAWASTRRR
ncbi:YcbK family protein [Pseudoroseomonas sp. WGS1072]|uniref:YcbK family protein n=1 Tax=Roseomonas sp. WGS1072 TaxID=3366816 RepID=UPI003BF304D1